MALTSPDRRILIEEQLVGSPVARNLGMRLASLNDAGAVISLPFSPANVATRDMLHGGVIAALADVAGVAAAAAVAVATPTGVATASLSISYLTAARGVDLIASGVVLKTGRRLTVVRVGIVTRRGDAVAEALVTVMLSAAPTAVGAVGPARA